MENYRSYFDNVLNASKRKLEKMFWHIGKAAALQQVRRGIWNHSVLPMKTEGVSLPVLGAALPHPTNLWLLRDAWGGTRGLICRDPGWGPACVTPGG